MKTHETEPLYKKVGRRYVPVHARWYEEHHCDQMKAGTFRLTYAYTDGGRRYEYDVTPATAPMVAAMMVARRAIEETILDKARSRPDMTQYTKGQKKLIVAVCGDLGIPAHGVSPKGKVAKLNAEQFAALTGWTGRSNQHERDGAMLAWPYRGASA